MSRKLVCAVDFDATLVRVDKHYNIIELMPNAKEVVNWAHNKGCIIIIWTCRADKILKKAIDFLDKNDVKYDFVNENFKEVNFKTSRKIFYDILIDDKNIGIDINWLEFKKLIAKKIMTRLAEQIEEKANV